MGTDTPHVARIDGKGPKCFGSKYDVFNTPWKWNEGFTVRIPAGPHTVTMAFYVNGSEGTLQPGRTVNVYGSSDYIDASFVAEAGHTYTINELSSAGRWKPIILDVTKKSTNDIASTEVTSPVAPSECPLDDLIKQGTHDVNAYLNRAKARSATGDVSGAIEDYTKALD
jgi:hypothetical protein